MFHDQLIAVVSKFTATSRGSPCDSTAFLFGTSSQNSVISGVYTTICKRYECTTAYSHIGCVKESHGSRHEIIKSNQKPNSVNRCMVILRNNPAKICIHPVWKDSALGFLADRTATQYDRLMASSCWPCVCLSVRLSVTLCIVALRVGVHG